MVRCPNCGAHRNNDDDYCPVCGETFAGPHLSEATGPPWYHRTSLLLILVILLWPVGLYGLYRRDTWNQNEAQWILGACLLMVFLWSLLLLPLI